MEDLSRYHHPITDLFPHDDDLQRYRLSESQVRFYRENGFVAGIKILNDEQLRVLREELAALVDPAHPGNQFFYEFNANESALDFLSPEQRSEFKPVAIELKAGECSFHHPLMVHGSYANQTANPRRGLVINAFRDGVMSASDEPLLEGVAVIPSGQKIEGQFFPLLFDGKRSVRH